MNAHHLRGMSVISLPDQRNLGQVEQPFLDLSSRLIAALQVQGEFGTFVIPFAQVQSITMNMITVVGNQVAQVEDTYGMHEGLVALEGTNALRLEDSGGTFLGTLREVAFDPATGAITQITVHKGGVFGIGGATSSLDARVFVRVSPKVPTVPLRPATALIS